MFGYVCIGDLKCAVLPFPIAFLPHSSEEESLEFSCSPHACMLFFTHTAKVGLHALRSQSAGPDSPRWLLLLVL